jgi:hypothetical protein
MSDLFKLEIRLDGQSMSEFGKYLTYICCDFPAGVQADADQLGQLCSSAEPDLPAVRAIVARLRENAQLAVRLGDGVATLIGMCQPERIDGGPVQ